MFFARLRFADLKRADPKIRRISLRVSVPCATFFDELRGSLEFLKPHPSHSPLDDRSREYHGHDDVLLTALPRTMTAIITDTDTAADKVYLVEASRRLNYVYRSARSERRDLAARVSRDKKTEENN